MFGTRERFFLYNSFEIKVFYLNFEHFFIKFFQRENVSEVFSFGYYAGFAMISLFISVSSLILIGIIDIYRRILFTNQFPFLISFWILVYYITNNSPKLKDYEKMMILATSGFSFGCIIYIYMRNHWFYKYLLIDFVGVAVFRIGGSLFQSSINISADLIGKIDKGLPPEELAVFWTESLICNPLFFRISQIFHQSFFWPKLQSL